MRQRGNVQGTFLIEGPITAPFQVTRTTHQVCWKSLVCKTRQDQVKINMKFTNLINVAKTLRLSALSFTKSNANAMISVKGGTPWVNIVVRLLTPLGFSITRARVRATVVLLRNFYKIGQCQGIKGLTLYLKANAVLMQQSLGGHMIKDASKLGPKVSRTNVGLPRAILREDRLRIRSGETRLMKFYLTIFNIYRVLDFPGTMKLKSITGAFTGKYKLVSEILQYIPAFVTALKLGDVFGPDAQERAEMSKRYGLFAKQMMPKPETAAKDWLLNKYQALEAGPIHKSAPGTKIESGMEISTHPMVLVRSAITLNLKMTSQINFFLGLLPFNSLVRRAFEACCKLEKVVKPLPSLGKLGIKEEAAGKVRVFAMVDAWTQWLLDPVHQMYFTILRRLPQDGTFDQLRPLRKAVKWPSAYSLDLSSATDRIPLWLQEALLGAILADSKFAKN